MGLTEQRDACRRRGGPRSRPLLAAGLHDAQRAGKQPGKNGPGGPAALVRLTGNVTHSPVWAQIVADVLGVVEP